MPTFYWKGKEMQTRMPNRMEEQLFLEILDKHRKDANTLEEAVAAARNMKQELARFDLFVTPQGLTARHEPDILDQAGDLYAGALQQYFVLIERLSANPSGAS